MFKQIGKKDNWPIKLLLAIVLLLMGNSVSAAIKLAPGLFLDAYLRPRIEYDGRDFNNSTSPDQYATLRTRLGLKIEDKIPDTIFYFQLGDSRRMGYNDPYNTGETLSPNSVDSNLGVIKSWVRINNLFSKGTYLKVGRMSNDQGGGRLFGPGNWSYSGPRTFDGLKLGFEGDLFDVNIWSFYGAGGDRHWYSGREKLSDSYQAPNKNIDYKHDHTLLGMDLIGWKRHLHFLFFLDHDASQVAQENSQGTNSAFSRFTFALFGNWENRGLKLDFDLAYQLGNQATKSGQADISAWLATLNIIYSFEGRFSPFIRAGFDVSSGDDHKDPGQINYFYEFYYSGHNKRGHMDFFKKAKGIASYGLQDLIFQTGANLTDSVSLKADVHYFRTQKAFSLSSVNVQESKPGGNFLGVEVDLTFDWLISSNLKAQLGVDLFFPSKDWQGSQADPATFVYSSITAIF